MFREKLRKITQRQNLGADEMAAMIGEIFSGTLSDALIGAFIAALATKGETFEELAGAARKELGIRSIFNMLGPLTNPAGANCQLLGVYAPPLTEMFAEALRLLGSRRALVVHGHDGLDEISACAPTRVTELKDGLIRTFDIDPERFLGRRATPADVAGGDPARNAEITRGVLAGAPGACRDVVVLNAAAALMAAGKAESLEAGMRLAAESIDSGAARRKLDELVDFTRRAGG
jgi:anthranilate phosphoribosyltransferase